MTPRFSGVDNEARAPCGSQYIVFTSVCLRRPDSTRAQSFDPSLYSAMGIDPASRKILLIKSTNHFYASFSKIAAQIIYCAAGHPYPNTPATTAYRKAPKNIWPRVENPWE